MEEREERKTRFDYRHIICIVITIGLGLVMGLCFNMSLGRLIEAFRDFGLSVGYYFYSVYNTPYVAPSVNTFSKYPLITMYELPATWEGFKANFVKFWQEFVNPDNITAFFSRSSLDTLSIVLKVLTVIAPLFIVGITLLKWSIHKHNTNHGYVSKPLKAYRNFYFKILEPIINWIKDFFNFIRQSRIYFILWLIIAGLSFNVYTIAIEIAAYYLYFCGSFDFLNIYKQLLKLTLDLSPLLSTVPLAVWLFIGLKIFLKIRENLGYDELDHMELMNRGFIKARPISLLNVGTMGTGKSLLLTDMTLSQDVMFKNDALQMLMDIDYFFPYFPWVNLQDVIKKYMKRHVIYNLYTARQFAKSKRSKFIRRAKSCRNPHKLFYQCLFGADYRYSYVKDNGLVELDIWDVIEAYIQLYFLYVLDCSNIMSTYSIRTDWVHQDVGNFPILNDDFFRRDPKDQKYLSKYSHILDWDLLRLGKRVDEDNDDSLGFEFGVIAQSEKGKERGNQLDHRQLKADSETANALNDLNNLFEKLARHFGTVKHHPFVRIIADEQRPESIGADCRELAQIIHIDNVNDDQICLPAFIVEEYLHQKFFDRFNNWYIKLTFERGDFSILIYLIKSIMCRFHNYYVKKHNIFDFRKYDLLLESGTQDGKMTPAVYYICKKKAFADRYSTDCFSGLFESRIKRCKKGMADRPTFSSTKATLEELEQEHSYMVERLKSLTQDHQDNEEGDTSLWD